MSFRELKVVIGVTDNGQWTSRFGRSLRNLEMAFRNYSVKGWPKQHLRTVVSTGSVLPKARLEVLREAKNWHADYLLWIDADQTFPRETIHRLIARGVDVVAANVATKQIPASPTARNRPLEGSFKPIPVYTDAESKGLEEVWRIGTGVMLMSKAVIKALPENCFEMRYNDDVKDYVGEDWCMCEHIERLGFKIFIDHDLSQHVGHVGFYEFTHDCVGEMNPTFRPEPEDDQDVGNSQPSPSTPAEATA